MVRFWERWNRFDKPLPGRIYPARFLIFLGEKLAFDRLQLDLCAVYRFGIEYVIIENCIEKE